MPSTSPAAASADLRDKPAIHTATADARNGWQYMYSLNNPKSPPRAARRTPSVKSPRTTTDAAEPLRASCTAVVRITPIKTNPANTNRLMCDVDGDTKRERRPTIAGSAVGTYAYPNR